MQCSMFLYDFFFHLTQQTSNMPGQDTATAELHYKGEVDMFGCIENRISILLERLRMLQSSLCLTVSL